MDKEKVIDLLCERILIDGNDPIINKIWSELTMELTKNEKDTIDFIKNCTKEQLFYISEIFEDISYEFKSRSFIEVLYELNNKYPELKMKSDIDLAKSIMEED